MISFTKVLPAEDKLKETSKSIPTQGDKTGVTIIIG